MIAQTEEDLENADTITLREVAKRYNCRESNVFSLQICMAVAYSNIRHAILYIRLMCIVINCAINFLKL